MIEAEMLAIGKFKHKGVMSHCPVTTKLCSIFVCIFVDVACQRFSPNVSLIDRRDKGNGPLRTNLLV